MLLSLLLEPVKYKLFQYATTNLCSALDSVLTPQTDDKQTLQEKIIDELKKDRNTTLSSITNRMFSNEL